MIEMEKIMHGVEKVDRETFSPPVKALEANRVIPWS